MCVTMQNIFKWGGGAQLNENKGGEVVSFIMLFSYITTNE